MNFIILIAFLIPLWKLRFRKENFENYISPVQTTAINGFFVMLVFMRHINQYLDIGKYDGLFKILDSMLGQLIVTAFLFYSGYGIMYSIKNKNNYINSMPKRIVKILLQFDMAVVIYIFVNLVIGENLFWKDVLEALVVWKSLGNSTWYIFAILCLYIVTFVAGKISNNTKVLALLVTGGALLYILILKFVGKESHWYNTALYYPAGMFYAIYADRINAYFVDNRKKQIIALAVTAVLFAIFYKIDIPVVRLFSYQFAGILFVLGIVAFTMIFVVDNAVLRFLGKYLFEIYILQRIPMLLLQHSLLNKYIYFILCFGITLILAMGFKYIEKEVGKFVDTIFGSRKIAVNNR